jgi:hypothetical protein
MINTPTPEALNVIAFHNHHFIRRIKVQTGKSKFANAPSTRKLELVLPFEEGLDRMDWKSMKMSELECN